MTRIHSFQAMRLFAAFLVVTIHIPFEGKAGSLVIAFGKTAVPFFLVICGYFLYRDDNADFLQRITKQLKKIFMLTVAANLFYFVYVFSLAYSSHTTASFFRANFTLKHLRVFLLWNMSPFGDHLWYLGSLLYALCFLWLLCKSRLVKYVMFLAPILIGIYFYLSASHSGHYYYVYRNALFCTLGYVMMGCLIRRYREVLLRVKSFIYVFITAILCGCIVWEWNIRHGNIGVPYYSAELLVYSIVLLLLKFPKLCKGTLFEKAGTKYTLFIYIVHMSFIYIYDSLPFAEVLYSIAPVYVFLLTLLTAIVFYWVKDKIKTLVFQS